MVKVSVIVPVYNVDKYLEECLDSIINQTLKDIEIICVNDGSTDGSLKILEDYASKDERIKIITQENGGLSVARNTGIDAAIGEYISFVDSDDFIELSMFDNMYNQAHSQDLDIILCKSYLYDDVTGDIDDKASFFNLEIFDNFDKDVFNHFDTVNFIHSISLTAWAKLFKKDFISKNNFKNIPGIIFEDNPFFYETYLSANKVGVCPKFFYFYRVNREGSIVKSKDLSDLVLVFRLIRDILSKKGLLNVYKKIVYTYYLSRFYIRCNETSTEFKDKFLFLMKEEFNQIITEELVDGDDFRINIYDLPKDLQNKINNTLKANNYLEFKYLNLLDENNSLKEKNKKVLDENNSLKEINKKVLGKNNLLKEKNKKILGKNNLLKEKNKKVLGKNNLLKEKNKKMSNSNIKLKKLLQKEKNKNKIILNSNSWKITKPLRKIKNLF